LGGWHDIDVANGAAVVDLDVTGMLNHQPGVLWGMSRKYGAGTMRIRSGGNNTAGTYIYDGEVIFGAGGLGQGISGQAHKVAFYNAPTLTWDAGNTEDITASLSAGMGMYLEEWATPTLNVGTNNVTLANAIVAGGQLQGGIIKRGTGTLTLGGANYYRGDTVVMEGTLATSALDRIGDSSRIVVGTNGTFRTGGSEWQYQSISNAGVVNLQNNWFGSGSDGRSVVQTGQFIGGTNSTLVKYGVGKWTLTGSNNLLGNTDIEGMGSIISIDSLNKIGAGYLGMAGGTLQYTGTNDATKSGIFYSDRNSFSAFDIANTGVNFTLNSTNAASWKIRRRN
jgi:autotransporter-associated beta strand protein